MTWDYDPEDIPQTKHRDALRNELPPGAMRSEPTSDAERRDMYAFGDPVLRSYLKGQAGSTGAMKFFQPEHYYLTSETQREDLNESGGGDPKYRIWDEGGDFLGGSDDPDRAGKMMGGYIIQHHVDHAKANGGEPCMGCGVMTPQEHHGISIQNIDEDSYDRDPEPDYKPHIGNPRTDDGESAIQWHRRGSVPRASDTIWR